MIDYYFPPISGAAVRRTTGLVKHLAEFGWSPIVLTVHAADGYYFDSSMMQMIPDTVHVQRTASISPLRFARRLLGRTAKQPNNSERGSRSSGLPWRGPAWMRDFARAFLMPYNEIGWLPFAVARALTLSRAMPFDALYSTSTSLASHLIALILKGILNKPWVADFQDPWVDTYYLRTPGLPRRMGERIERHILQVADRVTFASEPLRDAIQRKYGLPHDKLLTLLLGFDPDAFDGIEPVRRAKFTITHFGSLYGRGSPCTFLKALGRCVQERRSLAQDIEVLFFGSFDVETLAETEALLDQYQLRDIVRLEGIIAYQYGLQYLRSSDVLVLFGSLDEYGYTLIHTKLFDYLGAGKPILAITPNGPAAQIVRQANAGVVVHPDDVEAIKNSILDGYERWRNGDPIVSIDQEVVKKCTAREVTRQFATILDDVLDPRPLRSTTLAQG